jgi:predicted transglutaminase-like cysteine proteinase
MTKSFIILAMTSIGLTDPPQGAENLCDTYRWACSTSTNNTVTQHQFQEIAQVNRSINRSVRQISDIEQYGVEEYWALPTSRGGDCEDIALLKKRELIRIGIPAQRLLIATVLDQNRQGHAVLVYYDDHTYYVLDSLTNRILPWNETGYTFIRMQNPRNPSTWILVLNGGIISR